MFHVWVLTVPCCTFIVDFEVHRQPVTALCCIYVVESADLDSYTSGWCFITERFGTEPKLIVINILGETNIVRQF